MRVRASTALALAIALGALAAWRASCVLAGADIDTDAYAHHMIARAILSDPRDLAVHWVWLPLFHYLQVPLVALGGTMEAVRWTNLALAAALPVVLFLYVRRTARSEWSLLSTDATALVAALLAAVCPIAMQMGTTAQPEPLFALVILGVAIAFQEQRAGWTAALLAAAVMLRYEAWASLAVVGAWAATQRGRQRTWLTVAAPVAAILAWAALRRPVDGTWFAFLRQTKEFANDATHARFGVARDAAYYPVFVAWRVMGSALPLVPFGIVRTWRQQGARFVLVLAACLGFVSLSWITRSSLGLDRHFVCIVPLYATFAAQGVAAIADAIARWTHRATVARHVAAWLAIASLCGMCVQLDVWMGFWRASIVRGWPDRAATAAFVRAVPGEPTIFCDEATLEIPTGLSWRRFDRHWVDDPHTWDLIEDEARRRGVVYVATWRRKLVGHEGPGREIAFAMGASPESPSTTGFAVMRVER
ncbi:MAG TPA: hypothetical protein VF765_34965 [Polyangiaceae bacterium]